MELNIEPDCNIVHAVDLNYQLQWMANDDFISIETSEGYIKIPVKDFKSFIRYSKQIFKHIKKQDYFKDKNL